LNCSLSTKMPVLADFDSSDWYRIPAPPMASRVPM
jgi:hypothetical protein